MARLHQADLTPTKQQLLGQWLPSRGWYDGTLARQPVGSFRFDDPDGLVGMEGFLLGSVGGSTLFVPLTYRPVPLVGADRHLIGTMEHSVLGTRWTYDACGDPVWATALATAILTGGTEAVEEFEVDARIVHREPSVRVRGSGDLVHVPPVDTLRCHDDGPRTIIDAGCFSLVVARRLGPEIEAPQVLTADWEGGQRVVLAGFLRTGVSAASNAG